MNHDFIYDIPVRIYFGVNQLSHLGDELTKYGKKVLLAYGGGSIKKTGLYDKVIAEMTRRSFPMGIATENIKQLRLPSQVRPRVPLPFV